MYPNAWILTLLIALTGSVQSTSESLLGVERTGQSYSVRSACLSVPRGGDSWGKLSLEGKGGRQKSQMNGPQSTCSGAMLGSGDSEHGLGRFQPTGSRTLCWPLLSGCPSPDSERELKCPQGLSGLSVQGGMQGSWTEAEA